MWILSFANTCSMPVVNEACEWKKSLESPPWFFVNLMWLPCQLGMSVMGRAPDHNPCARIRVRPKKDLCGNILTEG